MAHPHTEAKARRQDRMLNVLVPIALVVTVAILVVAGWTLIRVLDQGSTLDAQARTDAIGGCRSEYATQLATAEARLGDARDLRVQANFDGLVSYAAGDEAGLADAVSAAPSVRDQIRAARRERDRTEDQRSEAVSLSRSDPEAFLAQCKADFG